MTSLERKATLERVVPRAPRRGPGAGLLLVDLFQPLGDLPALAGRALAQGNWLDAFLVTAGGCQVIEDVLAGGETFPRRGWARRLVKEIDVPGRARQLAVAATRVGLGAADRAAERGAGGRRLQEALQTGELLREELAPLALRPLAAPDRVGLERLVARFRSQVAALPAPVREEVLRLPSCFRSFEQRPADMAQLVRRFSANWPDLGRRLVVVGARTSGSYLAPLVGASLRQAGYSRVEVITVRPGVTPLRRARATLARAAAEGGVAILVDDPPTTGNSLATVARSVEAFGLPPSSVVLFLCLAGPGQDLPAPLLRYPAVILPWEEWEVAQLLSGASIGAALASLLPAGRALSCRRLSPVAGPARGHAQARFAVRLARPERAGPEERELLVEGCGAGLFGRHELAVSRALGAAVPPLIGFADGFVFRWVLPGERVPRQSSPATPEAVARYVAQRHSALPARRDVSQQVAGRLPVWEAASRLFSPLLGRPVPLLRLAVLDPAMRRLLPAAQPSVVDGRMEGSNWVSSPRGIVKLAPASGAFSNMDLACYDPVYDLACAAAEAQLEAMAAGRLPCPGDNYRRAFSSYYQEPVPEHRWLIYQLVHWWDAERQRRHSSEVLARLCSQAVNRYFASLYLADVVPPPVHTGFCALDLDGCLESAPLGFSALSALGALALRALFAHGYTPLLATGRSAAELAERCATFGIAGGVAEYGSVLCTSMGQSSETRLTDAQLAALAALRGRLQARPDLEVDPAYRYSVRARAAGRGPRRPVAAGRLAEALASVPVPGPGWQVVVGENQTDIVAPGVDKGPAMDALVNRLSAAGGPPGLALAVGDSASDLGLLRRARVAVAPANASPELRAAGVAVAREGYQAAVAGAVRHLIGHAPGNCPLCAPRPFRPEDRLMARLLSTGGGARSARAAARLAVARAALGGR